MQYTGMCLEAGQRTQSVNYFFIFFEKTKKQVREMITTC